MITAFDLWFPKDERQRVLWPSTIRLSHEYFESLQEHAVPLDERALAALAHSAMALDVYSWLAQRLYRVDPNKPQFIPWTALKAQFGFGYARHEATSERLPTTLAAGALAIPRRPRRARRARHDAALTVAAEKAGADHQQVAGLPR